MGGYIATGWSALDALYMFVITVFGVGYGEVHEIDTPWLKAFTIFVIVSGTSSVIYIVSGLIQLMTQGEIQRALGARRMTRGIETQKEHAIICGYGRLGQILARDLKAGGFPLVIIDQDADRMREADEEGFLVLYGNAEEEDVLESAGIKRASHLATVLPNDADNVYITLTARNLNKDLTIISRGELPSTEKKLRQAGANHVILPPTIGGSRIAELILHPGEQKDRKGPRANLRAHGLVLVEVSVTEELGLAGKTVADLRAENGCDFSVVALRKHDGETVQTPQGDARVDEGDTLVVVSAESDQPTFGPSSGDAD